MVYRYETHLHTSQGSACGVSTGAEQARFYRDLGYAGIFVTDHFTGGNTAVPRDLPWKERVDWFCSGYEDALIEGQKLGLAVFFAWEQNFDGDEYLVYGPDRAWLLAHPDVEHWTRRRQLEEIHRAGGAVIQAHPFRNRDYIKYTLLGLKYCDGVEIANTFNRRWNDVCARNYAAAYGLPVTAGTDNHDWRRVDPAKAMAMAAETPLAGPMDYARRVLAREGIRPVIPEGWFEADADGEPRPRAYWIDEDDPDFRRAPVDRDFLRDPRATR